MPHRHTMPAMTKKHDTPPSSRAQTPPPAPPHPQGGQASRRALVLAGLAAAIGGALFALKRQTASTSPAGAPNSPASAAQAQAAAEASSTASAPLITGDQLAPAFWQQAFDTPTGKPLSLSIAQGKPTLINFWATWCPPCVKEMPELDRFHRAFAPKGWKVIGLAIDGPTPVKEFLAKVGVGFDIGLAGFGGTELAQVLGNTSGGLPFSVLIDAKGRVLHRKMGATHYDELAAWASKMA